MAARARPCAGTRINWREADLLSIADDSFVTTKQESVYAAMTQAPEMHRPPMYFTPDWVNARKSVQICHRGRTRQRIRDGYTNVKRTAFDSVVNTYASSPCTVVPNTRLANGGRRSRYCSNERSFTTRRPAKLVLRVLRPVSAPAGQGRSRLVRGQGNRRIPAFPSSPSAGWNNRRLLGWAAFLFLGSPLRCSESDGSYKWISSASSGTRAAT